jgi:twitching motility protein PilT
MARLDDYLRYAMEQRASDVHFSAGEPVWMRIDGDLVAIDDERMSSEALEALFADMMSDADWTKLEKNKNLDKSYLIEGVGNFRVNVFFMKRGLGAVIRSIPSKIPTMAELGLPPTIQALANLPKGLVLVTGPTGSGKSTTLAAILNHINEHFPYHILTIEDPVEFVHTPKASLVNQREIGENCHSFADALKYALREDPDVILVGEMRDLETIALALTAAETGHLVFGTLHTRSAGASVDRIIDSFPANQQGMVRAMLAESLAAVISQALLKKKTGQGRVAAYEIMVVNHAISNLIREGKTFQIPSIIQTSRKDGMVLMTQHMKELVEKGVVAEEEILPYLEDAAASSKAAPKPAATSANSTLPPMKVSSAPAVATPAAKAAPMPPPAAKAAPMPPPAAKAAPMPPPAAKAAPMPPPAAKAAPMPPPAAKAAPMPPPAAKAAPMPPPAAKAAPMPPPAAKAAPMPPPAAKAAPMPPPAAKAAPMPPPAAKAAPMPPPAAKAAPMPPPAATAAPMPPPAAKAAPMPPPAAKATPPTPPSKSKLPPPPMPPGAKPAAPAATEPEPPPAKHPASVEPALSAFAAVESAEGDVEREPALVGPSDDAGEPVEEPSFVAVGSEDLEPSSFASLEASDESASQVEPRLDFEASSDVAASADDNPADNVVLDFDVSDLKKTG